ncbi:hypothetical protein MTR67_039274, partial [Solanum verrucosum]
VHRLARLGIQLVDYDKIGVIVHNDFESYFVNDVKAKQCVDLTLVELKETLLKKSVEAFSHGGHGVLRYERRLCVTVDDLREQILAKAHSSWYFIHPGATKMLHYLREIYCWIGMKKCIVGFVAKCPNFKQVKVEHEKPGALSQDISIPTWNREDVNMDFIVWFPLTR